MVINEHFVRHLQQRMTLPDEEIRYLRSIKTRRAHFASGEVILSAGIQSTHSCMMLRGLSAKSHHLAGRPGERVITSVHVPGDLVDLHRLVLSGFDHAVIALGPVEAEFMAHDDLIRAAERFPQLTCLLWMTTLSEAAIMRQWLVAAGSLRSSAHLAHFLCELYTRLRAAGEGSENSFSLPLLQRELADLLGYTPIHVNRAVRDLRDRELIRWSGADVTILDWDGLVRLARFDPQYLQLKQRGM